MKHKSDTKRRAILEAAFAVVCEKGYYETKVEDIARRAGVAKGTVYLYFRDKADLYIGMVGWLLEQALALIRAVETERLSPRAKLTRILDLWAQGIFSRPAVIALLSVDTVHQGIKVRSRFHTHVLPHLQELTDGIARIIAQGIRAGEFRRVEPHLAAVSCLFAFRAGMLAVENRLPVKNPARAVQELFFCGINADRGARRHSNPRS